MFLLLEAYLFLPQKFGQHHLVDFNNPETGNELLGYQEEIKSDYYNLPVGQIQRLLRGQPVVDGLRVGDLAPVLGLLAVSEVHDGRELADPELPRLW